MIVTYLLLHGAEMNIAGQHMLKTTFPDYSPILTRLFADTVREQDSRQIQV